MTAKITKAQALQAAALVSLHIGADDLTLDGLALLSAGAANGTARFSVGAYLWEMSTGTEQAKRTERRAEILKATGVSKGTVSGLFRAGEILVRCGADAENVAREATAVCGKYNGSKTAELFAGKSGAPLVAAIRKADADIKSAENAKRSPRGAGKQTSAEKDTAKATTNPVGVVADAAHAVSKITKVTVDIDKGAADAAVRSLMAEAFRVGRLLGVDVESIAASIDAAMAEASGETVAA